MRTIKKILTLTAMAAALQACGGGDSVGPDLVAEPAEPEAPKAVFDPSAGGDGLPFPVDLLFASTADGSINIPDKPSTFVPTDPATIAGATGTLPAAALADPQTALNTMDGFSTTAPMVVRFSDSIDDSTIQDNVRVFRLTTADPGASGALAVDAELQFGVDFVAGSSGTTMLVQPLKPLVPGRTHIVVVENGLTTLAGEAFDTDTPYGLLHGSFLLNAGGALGAVAGQPDFVLQADGTTSCDLTSLAGLAACTDVNTEDYQAVVDLVPDPAAKQGAGLIGSFLSLYEGAEQVSTLIQLEQLRRITANHLATVAGSGVAPQDVVLTYSVTTENVGGALAQAKGQVDAAATVPDITILNPISAWDTTIDIEVVSPGQDGDPTTGNDHKAHIYLGTLDNMLQFVDPTAPNSSVWEADNASWLGGVVPDCTALPANAVGGTKNLVGCNQYTPAAKGSPLSVPVLISAPRAESLAGGGGGLPDCSAATYPSGLPVVIYQHGITSSRGTLMAIADTLASQCIVGVAIDMPKHGIAPDDARFAALFQLQAALSGSTEGERLVKVASPMIECQAGAGAAIPSSTDFYCPSGDNFINLTNLANARDTLRQAVVDLHTVYRALSEGSGLDAGTIGASINIDNIHFAGVSLGAIVGTPFVAQSTPLDPGQNSPALKSAVFNVGGGGIAKILDGSPTFEPSITAGLFNAAGLAKPSGDYEGFLIIAQTMVDSMDPMNFAESAAASGTPILAQEVLDDLVVPNNVFGTSFGPAWGLVAQTGQTGFLTGQNPATVPVGLAGTDALAQGTGFALIAGAVEAGLLPVANALALGPLGGDTVAGAPVTFKGMNLPTVTGCGAAGTNGVVRFTSGYHGSMLNPDPLVDPDADPLVTGVMQKQLATFVVSGGAVIADDVLAGPGGAVSAGVVFEPAVASGSTAACAP